MHRTRKTSFIERLSNKALPYLSLLFFAFLTVLILVPSVAYQYLTIDSSTGIVEHKERICDNNEDCYWMVFTDQGEYRNSDTLLHLKWDSTSLQREIPMGEEVTFTHYGWRVPFFSMYPNIIEVN